MATTKFPLITGSYTARSVTSACQRCVNLYMEKNPEGEVFPFTFYPTPGLRQLFDGTGMTGHWRGLYMSNYGILYGVNDVGFYEISKDFTVTKRGELYTNSGNPVQMADNGTTLIVVDGSERGYQYTFTDTSSFEQIDQDAFYGADTIAFADGFFILNRPGTVQWYISTANTATFDGTDFASKAGYMDLLVGVAVANRYVYLFGKETTEVWTDVGATAFAYSRLPGVYMQYGCVSAASIAQMDGNLFWLSQSPQGEAMVLRSVEMQAVQISTFALANELSGYDTLSDAVGWTYQLNGHMFYVLWFPTANKTWQYDMATQQWNELVWTDINGQENAHRAGAMAFAYRTHLVGDRETGVLYALDQDVYDDNGVNVVRRKGFVHGAATDFNRMSYNEVMLYMETGNGDNLGGTNTGVSLRWSDDGGKSWGNPVIRSLGQRGEYLKTVTFQRLGAARNRVFEVFWSSDVRTALSGAFANIEPHGR
jgi:hypothetical protein